ncbi:MAG: class I adenylate-forming enzyme family protein [Myxococcales bacterium]|nr:class I adenylate-forming enzyme family protein [Myxococcales bacterium]
MSVAALLEQDFGTIPELIRAQAKANPSGTALVQDERRVSYRELDSQMDRVAAALQRDGLSVGDAVAICARTSIEYALTFLGALRAGVVVAPVATSATAASVASMLTDCAASHLFCDREMAEALADQRAGMKATLVGLDDRVPGSAPFSGWLAPEGAKPKPVAIDEDGAFNIIYSSGTTGVPKGIVQPNRMRWGQVRRAGGTEHSRDAVALVSTPLYSNTTLVNFFPMVAHGGTVVLMAKFDAGRFLELAERERVTHAMLVPVQYQRIMDHPDFDGFDLSSFRMKFCTSAPFSAELKRNVLDRWPGGLIEYYGMTEGGGTCILKAHEFPDKLHTVGRPAAGHDIRLIGEDGRQVGPGEAGEVVGASPGSMMNGYHNQPGKTAEAQWLDESGKRFIRTGDIGRFDEDGFLTLFDRKKDMIISGGFNVYPSDLEQVLATHPAVAEAAVVGVPSERWGETPVAFVVMRPGTSATGVDVIGWANERLGKTQRLSALEVVPSLPRSSIGKVLKRQLRDEYGAR